MIKNLLNADEEPPEGIKVTIEDRLVSPPPTEINARNEAESALREIPQREVFEIPEGAKFFTPSAENVSATEKIEPPTAHSDAAEPFQSADNFREDEDLLEIEQPKSVVYQKPRIENLPFEIPSRIETTEQQINPENHYSNAEIAAETLSSAETVDLPNAAETVSHAAETASELPLVKAKYTPETPDETIRKSGMAYSAAIVLLVSIVFMMILGWFADLLFGSSPFGIVGGIILGAVIGFVQFFRITSSILK